MSSINKYRKHIFLLLMVALFLVAGSYYFINSEGGKKDNKEVSNDKVQDDTVEKEESIKISSLGNIIFHEKQLLGAKSSSGRYDFNPSFRYIKNSLESSDLVIGVVETTLSGSPPYTGYPTFKSPDEILEALKNTGIDVINYASNHILDSGAYGLKRTIKVTKEAGLDVVGLRETNNDKRYLIKEIKGKKIGIIGYAFETAKINGNKSINSIEIPTSVDGLINTFNYGDLKSFYKDIKDNIESMKSDGAEFIIASIHWGEEYESKENTVQREISKELSELGVNIILGGHPHVIQPYEIIENNKGEKTFVTYSQGNFLSNQCYSEIGDDRTEDGVLLNFTLGIKDNNLYLKEYEVVPTWVNRELNKLGTYSHTIIPINEDIPVFSDLENNNILNNSLRKSLERTRKVLGEDKIGLKNFE